MLRFRVVRHLISSNIYSYKPVAGVSGVKPSGFINLPELAACALKTEPNGPLWSIVSHARRVVKTLSNYCNHIIAIKCWINGVPALVRNCLKLPSIIVLSHSADLGLGK